MPFTTNENVSPYFNDYNANNNYHQILFRPSVPVQARELTQLQSILQNQVEKFANWAFRDGDIVKGCTITDLPVVPYIFLSDTDASANGYDTRTFVNTTAVSATSNLQARVIFANVGFQANFPNSNIIYLKYLNTGNNGATIFTPNELLQFYNPNGALIENNANVYTMSGTASANITGNAHGISIGSGVVYVHGAFVDVSQPLFGLVNAYGTNAGNNLVGIQAIETIVTENEDSSLNDNALGYSNYNAPGAHRLKITPTLISVDPTTLSNVESFNPIASYNYNAIITKSTDSGLYADINNSISTRMYEEAGNYVVNPFTVDTVSSTVDTNITPTSGDYMLAKVGTGVGYAMGSRVTVDKAVYLNERRGTDTKTFNQQTITFNYGSYTRLWELAGYFDCSAGQTVYLLNSKQYAVSGKKFTNLTPSGSVIGTARARCLTYSHNGFPGAFDAMYTFNMFDIQIDSGHSIDDVKSIIYGTYNSGTQTFTAIYGVGDVNFYPVVSGTYYGRSSTNQYLIAGSIKDFLFTFGAQGIKNLRDSSNNVNTEYVYRKTSSSTLNPNGAITVTITTSAAGGTDILPYGVGIINAAQARNILVTPTSDALSASLGNVSVSSACTMVVGTGLSGKYYIEDIIAVANTTGGPGYEYKTVKKVQDDTTIYVDSPFASTNTAATYYRAYPAGKNIFYSTEAGGAFGLVTVANSTSFTITLNNPPSSATPVKVTYDIKRSNTSPAKKIIKKNRFVKICPKDLNSKSGPWNLGYSDVSKVTAVYASSSNSYSISNQNVTNMFTFDTGQTDTHYDLAKLHLKPGMTLPGDYLLVQLDYFTPNTTPGVGFFTVESYPIDDVNSSNTNAIQTKDIPTYVSEANITYNLRDSVDFRPVASITSTDTGVVDLTDPTSVTTAISLASYNPSNTLSFASPAGGLNVPSYSQNLQSDYTQYLPRYDLVYIDSHNNIKIKEGPAGVNPQPPLYPDNAMAIAQIYVPAYPSITADQVDVLSKVNQSCFSICRDTTNRTRISLLSNRRYTMRDIGQLDNRISNLEYYVQLSLLQQEATNMSSTDANGVERYKNGIFVDPFNDFSLCDVTNPEFNIAIDPQKSVARPKFIRETIKLKWMTSPTFGLEAGTDYVNMGSDRITLKTPSSADFSSPIVSQLMANNSVSPIPTTASTWVGTLKLFPRYNSEYDLNNTGSLNMTLNFSNPSAHYSGNPYYSTWGDWRTNIDMTVNTGAAQPYNASLNYGATTIASQTATSLIAGQLYNTMTQNGDVPSFNYINGQVSAVFLGELRNATPSPDASPLLSVTYAGNGPNPVTVPSGQDPNVLSWIYAWK